MGLAAILFFLCLPWRRKRLTTQKLVSGMLREFALFFFVLFGAGLGALTLFPHSFWKWENLCLLFQGQPVFQPVDLSFQLQRIQWLPFQNILNGGWKRFLFLGNIIMFLPLGFFSALLWRKPHWTKSLLIGFGYSCLIETVQFFIGRSSDIHDVILNSFGALCGFWLFCLFHRLFPQLSQKFQCLEAPYGRKNGDPTASS